MTRSILVTVGWPWSIFHLSTSFSTIVNDLTSPLIALAKSDRNRMSLRGNFLTTPFSVTVRGTANAFWSDYLICQALAANFILVSLALALSLTSSLWAKAMRMTILGFP